MLVCRQLCGMMWRSTPADGAADAKKFCSDATGLRFHPTAAWRAMPNRFQRRRLIEQGLSGPFI